MKLNARDILPIYRRQLKIYEEEGRSEQAEIQRRLIKRIEAKESQP